ncbi:MAG: tRNA (cytidine(34)-2'-O)-methyltransferase [Planctomycetota bacterium]|nr:tRNA (cytidine(34)-2'-O)-methyltransferase [Planctomycetota bacterium]
MKYQPRLHVVLFQPEIPPNTGAIGRTCVAIAAKLWLIKPLGFQLNEKTLRRAGLDYWDHLEWETVDHWEQLTDRLDTRFFFFSKTANKTLYSNHFREGDALVFGSETSGLPDSLLHPEDQSALKIPIRNSVRSLNLSCSVAIAGYEMVRQIGFE